MTPYQLEILRRIDARETWRPTFASVRAQQTLLSSGLIEIDPRGSFPPPLVLTAKARAAISSGDRK